MLFDIALRYAAVAVLVFTAAALLASVPKSPVARWFAPFAIGLSGFLAVNTAFDAAELPGAFAVAASFASRMAALFLWLFCLVLFDGRLRAPGLALAVGTAWLALVLIDKDVFGRAPVAIDWAAIQMALGAGMVVHAGWRALRELPDDLVDSRRRARPIVVLSLLALLASDLAVDVLQDYGWRPASFLALQNGAILVLASALGLWLLRASAWLQRETAPRIEATDPEAAVLARIDAVMRGERAYLKPELTIAEFAAMVGLPEPTLRRAINHRLGHGHFKSFVNEHRVAEAKRRLHGSTDKIVAVALESGFASLASFNRVFRQVAGCSPSEFRAGSTNEDRSDGF